VAAILALQDARVVMPRDWIGPAPGTVGSEQDVIEVGRIDRDVVDVGNVRLLDAGKSLGLGPGIPAVARHPKAHRRPPHSDAHVKVWRVERIDAHPRRLIEGPKLRPT